MIGGETVQAICFSFGQDITGHLKNGQDYDTDNGTGILRADNGEQDEFITPINLTPDKARNYYVGRIFNMGTVEDKMMMCYAVHILQVQERRKAVVKVQTSFGRNCLNEIRGLKEGEVLEGWYNKQNKAFDFTYKGNDAMLWVGQNCELINE